MILFPGFWPVIGKKTQILQFAPLSIFSYFIIIMHYVTKNHFDNFDDDNGTESEVMVISAQMQLT